MKKILIYALACINLALLGGLVASNARGQAARRGEDYLMLTGKVDSDMGAVYVVNLTNRNMAGWRFDPSSKKMVVLRMRSLDTDFRPDRRLPGASEGTPSPAFSVSGGAQ
ncbi:MAG: hypothetical protein WC869_15140 [Phycisphaerae bacterium]